MVALSKRTCHVATHTSQPLKKNLFLQNLHLEESADLDSSKSHTELQDKDIVECLEKGVQYWTDFSKAHYHPQSLYEISGMWSDVKKFNNYGVGREAFSGGLHAEEINERLHFFVEECDRPQEQELKLKCVATFDAEAKVNIKVQENMTLMLKKLGEANPGLKFDITDFCATM
ncbi:hypothetical protein OROHE_006289 [Orobanche hederae]